jgi:type II secretory ATPase GspE/PulE/Tfp pilus assembly ATPase PilB-like protein
VLRSGFGVGAIERFKDMGADGAALHELNMAIVTQRLARALCRACRVPRVVSKTEFEGAGLRREAWPLCGACVYEPRGCPECVDGYRDRCVLAEGLLKNARERPAAVESFANCASLRVLLGQLSLNEARDLI